MKIQDTSAQDVVLTKTTNKRKWMIAGSVGAIALVGIISIAPALSRWSSADYSISSERLRLAQVTQGDLIRDLSVQGKVVAAVSPRLYTPAQGIITFNVDAGDSVKEGQILATIDSPELTNQLLQEQANLERLQMDLDRQKIQAKKQQLENQKAVDLAKVALVAADREQRRAVKAFGSKSISQIDYEKAQDDLENAKLVFKHAEADAGLNLESLSFETRTQQLQVDRQTLMVKDLQRKVDELVLHSPVDGIVGNLAADNKNQVSQNQAILSVVDLSEFELELQIPESYADDLAIGMDAEVMLNGEAHLATLVTISPEIENNQVTGRVRFSTQSPLGLRQNQRLTTRILMENKANVLMVQRGQFLDSSNGRYAYRIDDGVAYRTRINTGARSLANVEITDGLTVGDTIIISSTDQFQGAEKVLITN